jgi:VWFA-related protein
MRARTTLSLCLLTLMLTSALPRGQQAPPTYRSGIDLVTVDVTVLTRGGDPMTELTRDDFTVSVDGKPRPIVSVRLVRAGGAPTTPEQPAAAPSAAHDAAQRRFLVLVVDREHVPVGEGQPMLEAAAAFVDGVPAEDRIALWTLPYSSGALKFTENRDVLKQRLKQAVGSYRPPYGFWNVGRDEAIRVDDRIPGALAAIIARECHRQPDTCPMEVENQARDVARDARQRADATLSGLGHLIDALKGIDGPKHLVLVTGGPVTTIENLPVITALGQRAAAARVTIHALQVAQPSYQARPDQMRAAPEEINQSQSAAFLVAGATGGLALTPTAGAVGFNRLARQLSAGYVLVFETEPADRDGKDHKIEVGVRDRGWGSSVRARKSFRVDSNTVVAPSLSIVTAPAPPPEPSTPSLPPEPVGTEPGDMADRLADYAEAFERNATGIVAEERYVQIIQPWRGNPSAPEKEPALKWLEPGEKAPRTGPIIARRQLVSDILLAQLKDQQWVAYRDVSDVDGSAVRDRVDRVQKLFLSQSPDKAAQFQAIAMESSRYNLGDLKRDINLPTVAMSLLRRANHWRFEFKRQKDETLDGRLCRVLAYREKESPSLISTRNSGDVFIYGRFWIDQLDGRVRRSEFRFDRGTGMGGFRSVVRVDYGVVDGIDTLVPVRMWEWHEGVNQLGRIGGDLTGVQGLATYSNIRRFAVTTSETIK